MITKEAYQTEADDYGHRVFSPDDDGAMAFVGLDAEEADFAAMLLNAGVDKDDAEDMIKRLTCVRCEQVRFAGQMNEGICMDCQS